MFININTVEIIISNGCVVMFWAVVRLSHVNVFMPIICSKVVVNDFVSSHFTYKSIRMVVHIFTWRKARGGMTRYKCQ